MLGMQNILHTGKIKAISSRSEERLNSIINGANTNLVGSDDYIISANPSFSRGYWDCNGVVLMGRGVAGLSHYDTKKPKGYLDRLIKRMLKSASRDGLVAIIIGGDESHFRRNYKILNDQGIYLSGGFLDLWPQPPRYKKDLLVVPSTGEVYIYLQKMGIGREYKPKGYALLTPSHCI